MDWFLQLFSQPTVANSLVIISLIVAVGLALSKLKMGRLNLGVTWILFAGIAAGQMGLTIDPSAAHFVKEFGLILFIYSIGIEVGPNFFSAFKRGGLLLNGLAALLIILGCATAEIIGSIVNIPQTALVGILYGAVTNTPGLGAAQQTLSDIGGTGSELFAQGYAMAYPLGVVGIIVSITLLRKMFQINIEKENELFLSNASRNGIELQRQIAANQKPQSPQPNLFFIFFGIVLGVILGVMPIHVPGMSIPVKIGLAGGPLIISILLTYFGPRIHINTYTTPSANLMLRQVGISLFMAVVGLGAGKGFIQTVIGGGYMWVLYGIIITILPCIIVGSIARWMCRLSYFTIAGLISGATTAPPALAYSNNICGGSHAAIAYTTVYPLSMFLRVVAAQLMVIFTCF